MIKMNKHFIAKDYSGHETTEDVKGNRSDITSVASDDYPLDNPSEFEVISNDIIDDITNNITDDIIQ